MADCLFCGIASGEVPADVVHDDEWVLAFRDIDPKAPVHLLVIPRKHIASVMELEPEDGEAMGRAMLAARRLARENGLSERGFRIAVNCGPDAGQSVSHVHLHLLGGRSLGWPPG